MEQSRLFSALLYETDAASSSERAQAGMTHHLSLYTFGVFTVPAGDPANDGFHALNDRIFAEVDQTPGLVARSGYPDEPGPAPWGPQVWPRFYEEKGDGWSPATLSIWTDLQAARSFAFSGLHAEALRRRREWFAVAEWPSHVLWWVEEARWPTWREAVERYEALHDDGPSPAAFTFSRAFEPDGTPHAPSGGRGNAMKASR